MTAKDIIENVWDYEETRSFIELNSLLRSVLISLIQWNFPFGIDDFQYIFSKFQGLKWFWANKNSYGYGEVFYKIATIHKNMSACKSYEKWTGLKPFILEKKRLCVDDKLTKDGITYRVTGFSKDFKRINMVSDERPKKLISFDNNEWKKERDNFIISH